MDSSEWDKERRFELEKVNPIWLVTCLCVVPIGVYFLLSFLSPLIHKLTAMRISEIYVYPIKSLRAVKVREAVATKIGFKHDRTFMLLQKKDDGWKNMAVSRYPEMTQFLQEIDDQTLTVNFRAFGDESKATSISMPLEPDVEKLEAFDVDMHNSPTSAFKMPEKYSKWFSDCFGYEVILVYLGKNERAVLFQDMQPLEPDPLTRALKKFVPFAGSYVESMMGLQKSEPWKIGFADCAPYMVVSHTSLENVSDRLPEGEEMDVTKFRPNIVIKGAFDAFQEDYWGKIKINNRVEMIMAHNCVRCASINVDYNTGKPGEGASGEVLKRLQKDRRVDIGAKYSPVFGRYTFWDPKYPTQTLKVGDQVNVSKVNEGLTIWSWPNLA